MSKSVGGMMVSRTKNKLHVELGASRVRRRLKGRGLGVTKIQTAGKNRSVITHTATGSHLQQLESLLRDVIIRTGDEEQGAT